MPSFRRVLVSAALATAALSAASEGVRNGESETSTSTEFTVASASTQDGLFWPTRTGLV